MPINTDPRYVGRASITPADPVVAGQLGTWTITHEVGAYGYDEFARLKIASRFASDWGSPQFSGVGVQPDSRHRAERTEDLVGRSARSDPRDGRHRHDRGILRHPPGARAYLEHIRMLSPYTPESFDGSPRYWIAWAGSRVRGRDRLTTWVSNTTGDDDGIDVTIDAPADAVFRFRSPVLELEVGVDELADGRTRSFPAGGVDLRVFVRRLPARGNRRARLRAHRPVARARPLPPLLDPRDSRGWCAGLDEPRLSRRLSASYLSGIVEEFLEMADLCHVAPSNLSLPPRPGS